MFGLVKKLFGAKPAVETLETETEVIPLISMPAPAEIRVAHEPEAPFVPAPVGAIELSLKPIIDKFPDPLKATVRRPLEPGDCLRVPLAGLLPKLSKGCVKVSFAELRKSAPTDLFGASADHDQISIDLPLREILAVLDPSQLARRSGQKRLEVSDDVFPLFGPADRRGRDSQKTGTRTLSPDFSETNSRDPRSSLVSAPRPQGEFRAASESDLPAGVAPRPEGSNSNSALEQNSKSPPTIAPIPFKAKPSIPAETVSPADSEGVLVLPLAAVAGAWPEVVRRELSQVSLQAPNIYLPFAELEQALIRGRATFSWKQIRTWIQPPIPSRQPSASGEISVDLPLQVVAPLFLAKRKPAPPQKQRYDLPDTVPNIFRNRVQTFGPSEIGPPSNESALPLLPSEDPSEEKGSGKTTEDPTPEGGVADSPSPSHGLGQIFGQPARQSWSVSEIVRQTSQLKGVAGALLLTLDGLLIAAELPAGLAAETLAAFIPSIFSRLTQYSRELKFGEPRHLTFFIEDTPLQIFKTGCVYFALLGRVREPLPTIQLSAIAAALPRPALDS